MDYGWRHCQQTGRDDEEIIAGRVLINTRKSVDPMTDPYKTPEHMLARSDLVLLRNTVCFLP